MARTAEGQQQGMSPKDVGRQLRSVRRKQGLSRSEVARSAGLTRRELAAYERGRTEVPESDLWCLAGSCGVDVGELLPDRAPVKVSADLSLLAVGDSIRYLRSPVDDDDLLREYLAMIYELRNLPPGSKIPVRERDLMSLADALGGSPEKIEARLVELIGMSRQEAARLRAMIMPPASLPPAPDFAAPVAPTAYAEPASPVSPSDLYSQLSEPIETSDGVVDFFSVPRSDDPFDEPPPPPGMDRSSFGDAPPAPREPMAPVMPIVRHEAVDDSFQVDLPDDLDDPMDAGPAVLPDPFAAPAPSDPVAYAEPVEPMEPLAPITMDAPVTMEGPVEPLEQRRVDAFGFSTPAGPMVDEPDVDAGLDATPLEPITVEWPTDALDAERDLPVVDTAAPVVDMPIVDAPEDAPAPMAWTGPVVEDQMHADVLPKRTPRWDDPLVTAPTAPPSAADIAPIAWVAREDAEPISSTGGVSTPLFERAGSNWQVGGIFPATATADDGALALRRADARWALADLMAPGDFTVEAVVDFSAGAGFGILFRATVDDSDRVSGYSFDIDPIVNGGGYLIRQWEDNRQHWRPLAQAPVTDLTRLFGRHTVSVTLRADRLAVLVDGEPVLSIPGLTHCSVELGRPPCRGDRVGVQAWATTEVTIDTFRVARL